MIPGLTKKRLRTPVVQFATLQIENALVALTPGETRDIPITATRENVTDDLTLEAIGLPTGVTASFVPPVLTGGVLTAVMTLLTDISAPEVAIADEYQVRVIGDTVGIAAFATAALTVGEAPIIQQFTIGGDQSIGLPSFNSAAFTIPISRAPGYSPDITLSIDETLPDGVTRTGALVASGATTSVVWTFTSETDAQSSANITIRATGPDALDATHEVTLLLGAWSFPNAGSGVLGPGPNALDVEGKTVYAEERLVSALPTAASNAQGFRGYNGFGGVFAGRPHITYQTVDTPLGPKQTMRIHFYGQTDVLTAAGQTSVPWAYRTDANGIWKAAVYLKGTWTGELAFEHSLDNGETWISIILGGRDDDRPGTASSTSGSGTTVNGLWHTGTSLLTGSTSALLRVRVVSLTSGSVEVRVGFPGGGAPADFLGGTFSGGPTRIYERCLIRRSPNWTDGGNSGTKMKFFSQAYGNNHYVNAIGNSFALQRSGSGNPIYSATTTPPQTENGNWIDAELNFFTGTSGGSDGTGKIWINGVQTVNAIDVPFFGAGSVPAFNSFYYNPTYGGGGRPPPYPIYIEYCNFYRESAP